MQDNDNDDWYIGGELENKLGNRFSNLWGLVFLFILIFMVVLYLFIFDKKNIWSYEKTYKISRWIIFRFKIGNLSHFHFIADFYLPFVSLSSFFNSE